MSQEEQKIHVYCATHATVFAASRAQSELVCAEGHPLSTGFPRGGNWAYCCACQTFWEAAGSAASTNCVVCARPPARRYLCDDCGVLSIESSSPGKRQRHSIAISGQPEAGCSGCSASPQGKLYFHECQGVGFFTARRSCPFCGIDIAAPLMQKGESAAPAKVEIVAGNKPNVEPPHPSYIFQAAFRKPVAEYIAKLPSNASLRVSPKTGKPGAFEKDEVGSYWLAPYREEGMFIGFPQARQFTDVTDSQSWQDGFECMPGKGEVWIVAPAVLRHEAATQTWTMLQKGKLEVIANSEAAAPAKPTEVTQIDSTKPLTSVPQPNKSLFISVAVGASVIALILALGVYMNVFSFAARVDKALQKSDPFSAPDSIADIFNEEAGKAPNSAVLSAAGEKIKAKLEPIAQGALESYYRESDRTVEWEKIEKIYNLLSRISSGDKAVRVKLAYVRARVSHEKREYAKAAQYYQEALKEKPDWALPLNGLGAVHIRQDSPLRNEARAVGYYEQAIQVDPQFPWAYSNLSEYYQKYKKWGQAEYYINKALELKPNRPSFLRARAWIKRNQGDYCGAIKDYSDSIPNETDPVQNQKVQERINELRRLISECDG
jgi:tetratricopeptide (TPR) repeat protein